jgi:Na+/citrate or Na+/malate symporter
MNDENIVEPDEPRKCRMCEIVGGIFGITLGVVFLFISIDILSGGMLSGLISGGKEEVTDE